MRNFKHLFLLNIPIPIELENGNVLALKTPSIEDYYSFVGYRKLQQFFNQPLIEVSLNPELFGFTADTYLEFLVGIIRESRLNSAMSELYYDMFAIFEKITGTVIEPGGPTYNGVPLTDEDILRIREAYLISLGNLDIDGNAMLVDEEEDEFERKRREAEEKIKQLRKDSSNEDEEQTMTFYEMFMFVLHELQMSPTELKNLNFFGLFDLATYSQLVASDQIMRIAAGNGNLDSKYPYQHIIHIRGEK